MRVTLAGNVDSGKTQVYRWLTGQSVKQRHARTQCLRIHQLEPHISLVDSPGHEGLSASREAAIRMSNLVLYIVDCQRPDYRLLSLLTQFPTIIVLNKWDLRHSDDVTIPLRQRLATTPDRLRARLEDFAHEIGKATGMVAHPFMDIVTLDDISGAICPLSAKTGWGMDLLKSLLRGYAKAHPAERKYLYQESAEAYLPVGRIEGHELLPDGVRVQDGLSWRNGRYQVRKGYALPHSIVCLEGVQTPLRVNDAKDQEVKSFLQRHQITTVQVYAQRAEDWANLTRYARAQGLEPTRLSRRALDTILHNPTGLTWAIGAERTLLQLHPLRIVCSTDSVIGLLVRMTELPALYHAKEREFLQERYATVPLIQTDPRYVFLDQRRLKIIGVKLIQGVVKPGLSLQVYDAEYRRLGLAKILSIKDKHQLKSRWDKKNAYFALRIEVNPAMDFTQPRYLVPPLVLKHWEQYTRAGPMDQTARVIYQHILKIPS